jgi:hypothetical protein
MIDIQRNVFVDDETGEVLGELVTDGKITSQEALEQALEKIQRAAFRRKAAEDRKAEVLRRLDEEIKRAQSYEDYVTGALSGPIEAYVADKLAGTDKKSLKTPFGTAKWTSTKGGLKVLDNDAAVSVCHALSQGGKTQFADAIKVTEKFMISELSDEDKAYLALLIPHPWQDDPGDTLNVEAHKAFTVEEPVRTFKIDTGAK